MLSTFIKCIWVLLNTFPQDQCFKPFSKPNFKQTNLDKNVDASQRFEGKMRAKDLVNQHIIILGEGYPALDINEGKFVFY